MLRIACVAGLVLLVAAGCGASRDRSQTVPKLARSLAADWASRADAVERAVTAGDDCEARRLALSLQRDVRATSAEVPVRLRAPLLEGVTALADRIVCTPAPPPRPKPKPHPHPKPKPPGPGHGHGPGGDGGDGG